ncbi:MAG: transglutaminase-like domain-containing protein [Lachnospiraceae bacterium]|nr:transglutaminase-like domain-containing protein [Ruminococcus sp.]MCM1274489.1 transglutaminase-like domain-containing protein [Lachnospiraceae bacterium]
MLSHDPINEKTIEFNGTTAVVKGKTADSPIYRVSLSTPRAEISLDSDENGFTAEITLTGAETGFLTLTLSYNDGHADDVTLAVTENGFAPADVSDIAENNRRVAETAIEQPQNQVAEYIVKGGAAKDIREVLEEIQALSDEICSGLTNDYDKLRAISRWVSANIYYDYPAYDKGVPEETLSLKYMLDRHSSVCGGYSNMTSALCAAQGIKCWNVHGSSVSGGQTFLSGASGSYHEWNFAEIDGRMIWVDSGWNSFCYLRRSGYYDNGGICYRYFDIGGEYLALNHKASYAEYRDYFAMLG